MPKTPDHRLKQRKTIPFLHLTVALFQDGTRKEEVTAHEARHYDESPHFTLPRTHVTRPCDAMLEERITHHLFNEKRIRQHIPGAKLNATNILMKNDERHLLETTSFCWYDSETIYGETFVFTLPGDPDERAVRIRAEQVRLLADTRAYTVDAAKETLSEHTYQSYIADLSGERAIAHEKIMKANASYISYISTSTV